MREVLVRVPVEPRPKGRPRFASFGGHVHAYTPKNTVQFETVIKEHYIRDTHSFKYDKDQPICVSLIFGMKIPMSTPKSRRIAMNDGIIRHTKKPDLDNLIKSVLDALNTVAWEDDAQIVRITAQKAYSSEPYVMIRIYESVD